jgi:hypothetical protein
MGEEIKVYKVLVGKPEGKKPLGRPRRRWGDGIRMDLRETGLGGCGLDWAGSGQGPVAGCCECGDEPSGSCATELVSSKTTKGPIVFTESNLKINLLSKPPLKACVFYALLFILRRHHII